MNKIINIQKNNDTVTFKVYTDKPLADATNVTVVIDEFCNYANVTNRDITKHNYNFNNTNATLTLAPIVESGLDPNTYVYQIGVKSDIIKLMDNNMKYVKFINKYLTDSETFSDGIYYDPSIIYIAELNRIKCFNDYNMTDDQMQYIMIVTFKKQLLDLAINDMDNINAMHLYNDLVDILNVNVKKDAIYSFCSCYNVC